MDKKTQKKNFIELANIIRECGRIYSKLLNNVKEEDIQRIIDLEEEGDKIRDALDEDFRTQKNIPYLALDRAKLLRRLDDVLDMFLIGSKNIGAFEGGLPVKFDEEIVDISKNIENCSTSLAEAIEIIYSDFSKCLQLCSKIEELRDASMKMIFDLEYKFYNELDDWKEFVAVSKILEKSMDCIVIMKEASEVLELMSYKYD